jgi:hypothetical protein
MRLAFVKFVALILFPSAFLLGCGAEAVPVERRPAETDTNRSQDDPMRPDTTEPDLTSPPVDDTDSNADPRDTEDTSQDSSDDDGSAPNKGWISGPCQTSNDCSFENGTCLREGQGYPGGHCTKSCDRLCPDREGKNSVTYCIRTELGPRCVARCDYELYPKTGCRDGYVCRVKERVNQEEVQRGACVPKGSADMELSDCLEKLDELGVGWGPWDYSPYSPDGHPNLTCSVDDPIFVSRKINGVKYRYFSSDEPAPMPVSCELAVALHESSKLLHQWDIAEVEHLGTFNCRTIAGTGTLSTHGEGKAIDYGAFIGEEGTRYSISKHWEHNTESPTTRKGRMLYNFAQQLHEERIFNVVLTPNYNSAHDGHFHVDLSEGVHFIRSSDDSAHRSRCGGYNPAPRSFY